jgi:hypothetical protein
MPNRTINLDNDDMWYRLRCPNGHNEWRAHPDQFECLRCGGWYSETDPEFDTLQDTIRGTEFKREDVEFEASLRSRMIVEAEE